VLEHVHDDFGVGLGREVVGRPPMRVFAQLAIILDDAVEHDCELARVASLSTDARSARVTRARASPSGCGRDQVFALSTRFGPAGIDEILEGCRPRGRSRAPLSSTEWRLAGGVVTAVLEAGESPAEQQRPWASLAPTYPMIPPHPACPLFPAKDP